jgi:wingless-type MMTV integration site family protein 6
MCRCVLQAVTRHMRMVCKCHGLSGSCTLRTCWRKMPTPRTVSAILKQRFDGAVKVTIFNDGKTLLPIGEQSIKPPTPEDLVYSMPSPDYCEPNKSLGSLGTARRECDPDSLGVGGCDQLCCDRGYTTEKIQVTENCNCRFRWCCEVICQTCRVTKYIHRCKKYK